MVCKSCNTENRVGAMFCKECGVELYYDYQCPTCLTPLRDDHKYCDVCGTNQKENLEKLSKDPYKDADFEPIENEDSFIVNNYAEKDDYEIFPVKMLLLLGFVFILAGALVVWMVVSFQG